LKIPGLEKRSFKGEHANSYFVKVNWYTYETRTLLKYSFLAIGIVCLQTDSNREPLEQNKNEQQITEK
jgi:hypothetical protein